MRSRLTLLTVRKGPAAAADGPEYGASVRRFLSEVDSESIESYLRYLTSVPHMGGTPADWEQADYMRRLWQARPVATIFICIVS